MFSRYKGSKPECSIAPFRHKLKMRKLLFQQKFISLYVFQLIYFKFSKNVLFIIKKTILVNIKKYFNTESSDFVISLLKKKTFLVKIKEFTNIILILSYND